MKMKDASYVEDKITLLMSFPVIKENLEFLKLDFERVYKGPLDQDDPEEVPEDHLSNMKSDLFSAFCHGCRISADMASEFRQNFKLPKHIMEEISKPKIITPDNDIKTPGKIIT